MEGVWISTKYSWGCPELTKMGAQSLIFKFVRSPTQGKLAVVIAYLERLEPFLYYQLIGMANNIADPFDERIIRAFWLGNDLLKPVTKKDIESFLSKRKDLGVHSLPLIKIMDLIGGKPNHNFEILWLLKDKKPNQILRAKFLEDIINKCLVRAGEIIEIKRPGLVVKTIAVNAEKKEIVLKERTEKISFGFMGQLRKGDIISVHLGTAREIIERETSKNLLKITEEALTFFQKGQNRPFLFC